VTLRPSHAVLALALGLALAACHGRSEKAQNANLTVAQNGQNPEAATVTPGITCRASAFMGAQGLGVAKVSAAKVAFILDTLPGCPSDAATCQGKAFVMKGDTVLTGVVNGPYLCVLLPNKAGGIAGWVKPTDLALQAVNHAPGLDAWTGAWKNGSTVITLTNQGGQLVAAAVAPLPKTAVEAAAPAAATTAAQPAGGTAADAASGGSVAPPAPPAPTEGKMNGVAQPVGDTVEFADANPTGCRLDLRLVGPFLMAGDNGQCAGGLVRFSGIFRKPGAGGSGPVRTGALKSSNPNTTVFY
jgi:hypothetical protein